MKRTRQTIAAARKQAELRQIRADTEWFYGVVAANAAKLLRVVKAQRKAERAARQAEVAKIN